MSPAEIRSLLFAPACDEGAILAALGSAADLVVLDLEDLTPRERKQEARHALPRLVTDRREEGGIGVRINAEEAEMRAADLELVARLPVDLLLVPKASPALLADLGPLDLPVVAIVETAHALREAYEIARAPGVEALALGANDLAASLGLDWPLAQDALAYARARVVFEAAAAGLPAPFDRVTPSGADADAVRADAAAAERLGFAGKSCTRPAHAAVINDVFAARRATGSAAAAA